MALPTERTKAGFHVELITVATGKWVQKKVLSVPLRLGSMRKPAGPSATTVAGMPRRGMPLICPAAPGTICAWLPMVADIVATWFPADPTIKSIFSSSVIAFMTSAIGATPSCGAAAGAWAKANVAPAHTAHEAMIKRCIVMSYWLT